MDLITIAIRVLQLIDSIEKSLSGHSFIYGDLEDHLTECRHVYHELEGFHHLISHLDQAINPDNPERNDFVSKADIMNLASYGTHELQLLIEALQRESPSSKIVPHLTKLSWAMKIIRFGNQVMMPMKLLVTTILVHIMKMVRDQNQNQPLPASLEGLWWEGAQSLQDWLSGQQGSAKQWQENMLQAVSATGLLIYQNRGSQKSPTQIPLPLWPQSPVAKHLRYCFLKSLQYEGMSHREVCITQPFTRTFEWISRDSATISVEEFPKCNFGQWLKDGSGIYWITGKPGSGKSTLMKFIHQDESTKKRLQYWRPGHPLVTAAFYFCNSGTLLQKDTEGMLRSLLYQVVAQSGAIDRTLPAILDLYALSKDLRSPWTRSELFQAFRLLLEDKRDPLNNYVFFLDGLDEFVGDKKVLITLVHQISSFPNVKICVSSRSWIEFQDSFNDRPKLILHDLMYKDILHYVRQTCMRHSTFDRGRWHTRSGAENLFKCISVKSSGVFLWAVLVTHLLLKGSGDVDTFSLFQLRLEALPSSLKGLYRGILTSLKPKQLEHALKLFQICQASTSRLTVLQLSFADEEPGYLLPREVSPLRRGEISRRALKMALLLRQCEGLLKIGPIYGLHAAQSRCHEPINFSILDGGQMIRLKALLEYSGEIESGASARELGLLLAQNNVGYLDRTLKDFLEDALTWDLTISGLDNEFDPYVHLCRAYTLQLKTLDLESYLSPQNVLLDTASWCLEYASKIRRDDQRLHLYFLDEIDRTAGVLASQVDKNGRLYVERYSNSLDSHWSAYISGGLPTDGFLAFAARCHLYDYVRDKLATATYGTTDTSRILFTLITNYRFPRLEYASRVCTPDAPDPRMVRLMLEHGAKFDFTTDGRSTWQNAIDTATTCGYQEARTWKEILHIFTEYGANEPGTIRSLLERRSRKPEVMKFSAPKFTRASCIMERHLDRKPSASPALRPSLGHNNDLKSRYTASFAAKDFPGTINHFSNFIEQIFIELCLYEALGHEIATLNKVLPNYLFAFTERLAQKTATHGQYSIIDVLRKHKDKVAGCILRTYNENFEGTQEEKEGVSPDHDERHSTEYIHARKKTLDWLRNVSDNLVNLNSDVPDVVQNERMYPQGSDRPAVEESSIISTTAFQWLVSDLRRELRLDHHQLNHMRSLSQQILLAAPDQNERGISPRLYRVSYTVKWDLMSFLRDQYLQSGFGQSLELAFEQAIVLSGSTIHGQATTCREYLQQTWPVHANIIIEILKSAIKQVEETGVTTVPGVEGQLLDETRLKIHLNSPYCIVEATGRLVSVAEICEIVAWMSAAFQPSPYENAIAIISPYIKRIVLSDESRNFQKISCSIGMNYRQAENEGALPGLCWYSMFKNPVMVEDFPTPIRSAAETGIEMPLELMARLVGTKKVQEFLGALFLKGSASMLYPTESDGRVISWHHDYNADGKYLSYIENSTTPLRHVSFEGLATSRHIVGWCKTVENLAGSSEFPYGAVKPTFLEEPPSYAVFDRLTVSGGKYITASISMAIGSKDQPTHVPSDDYTTRLENQRAGFFVLWDTNDKRGWLLSGNHVILHLVREFLHDKAKDKEWSGSFLCGQDSLQTKSLHSPFQILKNDENRRLRLYTGKHEEKDKYKLKEDNKEKKLSPDDSRTYFIMEQLVEQFLEVLEKVTDYQKKSTQQQGHKLEKEALKQMKARHKSHIQGYDFRNIVQRRSEHPRVEFKIDNTLFGTTGWRDLITEIHATPLFGRNFGEILRPLPDDKSCKHWSVLPKDQYYLAMTVDDLSTIIDEYGGETSQELVRITKKIYLHSPADPIRTCSCVEESYRCDYCQILISDDQWKLRFNKVKSCGLSPKGAIVLRQAGPWELGEQKVLVDGPEQEKVVVNNTETVDIPVIVAQSTATSSKQSEIEDGSSGQNLSCTATRSTSRMDELSEASASTSTNEALGKRTSRAFDLPYILPSNNSDPLKRIHASRVATPTSGPELNLIETPVASPQNHSYPRQGHIKHSNGSYTSNVASDSLQDQHFQIEATEDTIHPSHISNTLTPTIKPKTPQSGSSPKTKKYKFRSKFLGAFWKRPRPKDS